MQITIPIFVIYGAQFVALLFTLFAFFSRLGAKRLRGVCFALLHVLFNSAWICYLSSAENSRFWELPTVILGLSVAVYSFYNWHFELKMKVKAIHVQWLVIHLLVLLFLVFQSRDLGQLWGNQLMLILKCVYAQGIAIYYAGGVLLKIRRSRVDKRIKNVFIVSTGLACFVPVILFFFEGFTIKYVITNLSFFLIMVSLIRNYYSTIRMNALSNNRNLEILENYRVESHSMNLEIEEKTKILLESNLEIDRLKTTVEEQSELLDKYKGELVSLRDAYSKQANELKLYEERVNKIDSRKNQEDRIKRALDKYPSLTFQQRQVAKLIVLESSHKQISDQLNIAYGTVTHHASVLYKKIGVSSAKQLRKKLSGNNR